MKKLLASIGIAALLTSGCSMMQSQDAYTGETKVNDTTKGAGIGAATGAIAGQIIGGSTQATLIGAGIGALAGGSIGYYMDKQENELRKELQGSGVQVARNGDNIRLIMPGNITFQTGSANINANFYPTLTSVAKVLQKYDDTLVEVSGHTDNTGSQARNQALSQDRANSVRAYLGSHGVSSDRLEAIGYGYSRPIASNSTEAGRSQNRRVEILLKAK